MDRMLMATTMLSNRLAKITQAKLAAGEEDPTPTIGDIEETHVLHVVARYMPYAAITFEYSKVKSQSGQATLGGEVQFLIQNSGGDFWNDAVIRTVIDEVIGAELTTPTQGAVATPQLGPLPYAFPPQEFDSDGIEAPGTFYNLCNANGDILVEGAAAPNREATYRNLVYYCDMPATRLFERTSFVTQSNEIDAYTHEAANIVNEFTIPPHKQPAFMRMSGQEVPVIGVSAPKLAAVTDPDTLNTPAGIFVNTQNHGKALFDATGTSFSAVAASTRDYSRKQLQFLNGPQTPKAIQPPLELWHQAMFSFSKNVTQSFPALCVPIGERSINVKLAEAKNMVFEFPNLYLQTIRETTVGAGDPASARTITYTPIFQKNSAPPTMNIRSMELYVNNLYVSTDVHEIFVRHISFTLIRVFREQMTQIKESTSETQLLGLKYPIETIYAGLRPLRNVAGVTVGSNGLVTGGNQNVGRDWHRMCQVLDATVLGDEAKAEIPDPAALVYAAAPWASSSVAPIIPETYPFEVPTISTLSLTVHGMEVFQNFPDSFYNSYITNYYGIDTIVSPRDPGKLMITLALLPGGYQPSGHLNFSRVRENFLKIVSTYASPTSPALLIIIGIALNFMLLTDGTALLRYQT